VQHKNRENKNSKKDIFCKVEYNKKKGNLRTHGIWPFFGGHGFSFFLLFRVIAIGLALGRLKFLNFGTT